MLNNFSFRDIDCTVGKAMRRVVVLLDMTRSLTIRPLRMSPTTTSYSSIAASYSTIEDSIGS